MTIPVSLQQMKDKGETFFIELYEIALRTGTIYLAACDEDIEFNGQTYIAVPFERGEISKSIDQVTDQCTISIGDVDEDRLAYIMNGFDFRGCAAAITRIAYPDSLETNQGFYVFGGYLDNPAYEDGVFSCTIKSYFPNIQAPSRSYQLSCNSAFGDCVCGQSKDRTTLKVTAVHTDGSFRVGKSYATNYWKDGLVSISGESRLITGSDDTIIRVNYGFIQDNLVGKTAVLERGCDKTYETCKNRYNNLKKFSGFPAIPFESQYR